MNWWLETRTFQGDGVPLFLASAFLDRLVKDSYEPVREAVALLFELANVGAPPPSFFFRSGDLVRAHCHPVADSNQGNHDGQGEVKETHGSAVSVCLVLARESELDNEQAWAACFRRDFFLLKVYEQHCCP
jgi:hypothetical protein